MAPVHASFDNRGCSASSNRYVSSSVRHFLPPGTSRSRWRIRRLRPASDCTCTMLGLGARHLSRNDDRGPAEVSLSLSSCLGLKPAKNLLMLPYLLLTIAAVSLGFAGQSFRGRYSHAGSMMSCEGSHSIDQSPPSLSESSPCIRCSRSPSTSLIGLRLALGGIDKDFSGITSFGLLVWPEEQAKV